MPLDTVIWGTKSHFRSPYSDIESGKMHVHQCREADACNFARRHVVVHANGYGVHLHLILYSCFMLLLDELT